jgi:hypothetical protein
MVQRLELLDTRLENTSSEHMSTCNSKSSSLNDIADCNLPLDNSIDLEVFNEKISGDINFRTNLVRIIIILNISLLLVQICFFVFM